jgi:hypothetical protein
MVNAKHAMGGEVPDPAGQYSMYFGITVSIDTILSDIFGK